MFCVKLWDVERGAAQIAPLVARGGVVIPFQNGIDSAEVLDARAGRDARARRRRLHCRVDPRAGRHCARGLDGAAACRRVRRRPDRSRARIRRRVPRGGRRCRARAGHSPRTLGKVRLPRCAFRAHLPCAAAARHRSQRPGAARDVRGGDARDDCRGGVRKASRSPDDFVARQLRALDGLPAEMRASMLGDLVAGHRLEAPWLCGRVAQLASQAGIAAPVNATIYAGLKPYLNGSPH